MKRYLRLSAEARILLGATGLYALLLWAAPLLALTISVATLLGTICLVLGRLGCALMAKPACLATEPWGEEFVSIHIATYSEPAEVVIATLDSLSRLSHPHYEVVILDNNTPNPALYEPVKEYCRKLGPKFRFFHFDDVKGAKAGALNISLDLSDPRTEVVLILDADYQAQPDILQSGLAHFVDSGVGLVQFPQAYRNSHQDCGLTWDYKLFFDVYMNLANHCNTVLSTGTAAFVRKQALLDLGGWSGDTLTEDAELGLRMHRQGYRGVYVPEVVAAGVMPTDFKSLRVQRRRWVLGNAQSLVQLWREPDLDLTRKIVMSLQLTAWASPLLLATILFLTAGLNVQFGPPNPVAESALIVSALAIVWYLLGTVAYFAVAVTRQGGTLVTAFRALLVHLGTQWEASLAWCELFVDSDKSFRRTNKFLRAPEMVALGFTIGLSLLCCGISFDILRGGGAAWLAFACSLLSVVLSAISYLRWNLHGIRQRTAMGPRRQSNLMPLGERLVPTRQSHRPSRWTDGETRTARRIFEGWSTSSP